MDTTGFETTEGEEINDLSDLKRKMKLTGTVTKTTLAGAIVDIGLDTPGVVHISQLKEGAVNRVEDVVKAGDSVEVWVRRVFPKKNRIELTMIEPLALEWRDIQPGLTLKGKVTRLEKFGAFIDVGAERPGLVHISEMAHDYVKSPREVVKEGDEVEVQVLNVDRRKKQIKLSMKALEEPPEPEVKAPPQQQKRAQEEPALRDEPVPSAMEFALREAMERSQTEESPKREAGKRRRRDREDDELENILNRTLKQKSGKKR